MVCSWFDLVGLVFEWAMTMVSDWSYDVALGFCGVGLSCRVDRRFRRFDVSAFWSVHGITFLCGICV